jgi:tetratricopeptide (TPR) repeat protein
MKTKEIAFTLPFAVLLFEIGFFRGAWKRRALLLLPLLLTLPIIPHAVLSISGEVADEQLIHGGELRLQTDIPRLHYLFTQFRVIVTYLRLLVLPVNQNLDYDYPVFTTFFTPPVFLSFLLLAALFALALYLWFSSRREPRASRLISFGIFWFFLTLAVESSLIRITDVIFEHRLYLPSIGLAVSVAVGLLLVSKKTASRFGSRLPLVAASLIIVSLAAATWQRNQVWQSEVRLWEDTVRKSSGKARPWYNLGTYLADVGRPAEAIPALSRAVEINPQHADAWHNLGRALLLSGRNAEAVTPLRNAVRLKPEMENAVVNLSVALINTGNHSEAVPHLERIRQRFPNWPEVRLNLGIAYIGAGDLPAARGELAALSRLAPHLAPVLAAKIRRSASAQ